jgi:hypothetical protein
MIALMQPRAVLSAFLYALRHCNAAASSLKEE